MRQKSNGKQSNVSVKIALLYVYMLFDIVINIYLVIIDLCAFTLRIAEASMP